MIDEIVGGSLTVFKFLVYYVIGSLILFNLGRGLLLLCTGGRYPKGQFLDLHATRIILAGLAVIAALWIGVVFYNKFVPG